MKRVFLALLVVTALGVAGVAQADCGCGAVAPVTTYYAPATTAYYAPATTTYYAPSTTASVVTGAPMPTVVSASYPSTVTTYYAPAVVEPVTTYYAPTPVTTYYAPTTVYSPVVAAPAYTYGYPYYGYYRYRVPGQPIRNLFR